MPEVPTLAIFLWGLMLLCSTSWLAAISRTIINLPLLISKKGLSGGGTRRATHTLAVGNTGHPLPGWRGRGETRGDSTHVGGEMREDKEIHTWAVWVTRGKYS